MKLGKFEVHPTAARFPIMSKEQLAALTEDIKKNGLIEPIVLTADGKTLVDGRNRYTACEKADVKPEFHKLSSAMSEAQIIDFISSKNMERRDLDPGQRALLAVHLKRDALAAEAKGRQLAALKKGNAAPVPAKSPERKGEVRELIAEQFNIGSNTVGHAIKVIDDAPRLEKQVMAGQLSLNEAYQEARAKERGHSDGKENGKTSETITLLTHLGKEVKYPKPKGKPTFNQTNEQVSWASWTWNPVTGCLHGCKYCYAREMAEMRASYRATYPVGFTPLFHHERLEAPANHTVPDKEEIKRRPPLGRVFVCSMADLYGKWVPDEWIEQVHAACTANSQWEYLMLTKFPRRYVGQQLPKTAWLGTSVDEQKRVRLAEEAFRQIKDVRVKWLSLEPLLAPLQFTDLSMFDLVVIGSQSATEQPQSISEDGYVPEFAPPFEWVARIVAQAREAKVPVYLKPNLLGSSPNSQCAGMQLPQESPRGIKLTGE